MSNATTSQATESNITPAARIYRHLPNGGIRINGYTAYRSNGAFACDGESETVRGTLGQVTLKIDEWIAAGDVRL